MVYIPPINNKFGLRKFRNLNTATTFLIQNFTIKTKIFFFFAHVSNDAQVIFKLLNRLMGARVEK